MAEHNFIYHTMGHMAQLGTDKAGHPVLVPDPEEEPETVVGCEDCGMGLEEASASPACLGVSLEQLLEDR